METQVQHTQTPWEVHTFRHEKLPCIISPPGDAELGNWLVARGVVWPQDAEFICLAVNSHESLSRQRDALLKACEAVLPFLTMEQLEAAGIPDWEQKLEAATQQVEAAIQLAREGQDGC